jgi:polysaccharide biosynthesis/export protein
MKKIFIPFIILFVIACVPQKKIIYVQPESNTKEEVLAIAHQNKKIQLKDELYVNITSISQEKAINMNIVSESGSTLAQSDITMISYTVNDTGYINLPVLGYIYVKDKTIEEVADYIQNKLKTYIDQPYVVVKLLNRNIAVIGEVINPGNYRYSGEKLTIFNAMALAGDISEYGNRKKVLVIREKNNQVIKKYIDLTSNEIFASDYYYIQSNDILYVEPLKARYWGFRNFPYSLILTTVTTSAFIYLAATQNNN